MVSQTLTLQFVKDTTSGVGRIELWIFFEFIICWGWAFWLDLLSLKELSAVLTHNRNRVKAHFFQGPLFQLAIRLDILFGFKTNYFLPFF